MPSNKPQAKVLDWLFQLYRQETQPGPKTKKIPGFVSPLNDPSLCYVWFLNPDSNRQLKFVYINNKMFNFLNILGDIIIDCDNIAHVDISNAAGEIKSEIMTINSSHSVSIDLRNYPKPKNSWDNNQVTHKIKQLELNCADYAVSLECIPSLEKFKLNQVPAPKSGDDGYRGYWYNHQKIHIENCPNLKEIDLSSIKFIDKNKLELCGLPNDCVIKFNKDLKFSYELNLSFVNNTLKAFYSSNADINIDEQVTKILSIQELFPNLKDKNPIEVKLVDFYKAVNKKINSQYQDLLNDFIKQEQQEEYFVEHPEEYKKWLKTHKPKSEEDYDEEEYEDNEEDLDYAR